MIEKNIAVNILEDIEKTLYCDKWKSKSIKTISNYMRCFEITSNEKIKKLMYKHKKYVQIYGETNKKTIKLAKKIDNEIDKIFKH